MHGSDVNFNGINLFQIFTKLFSIFISIVSNVGIGFLIDLNFIGNFSTLKTPWISIYKHIVHLLGREEATWKNNIRNTTSSMIENKNTHCRRFFASAWDPSYQVPVRAVARSHLLCSSSSLALPSFFLSQTLKKTATAKKGGKNFALLFSEEFIVGSSQGLSGAFLCHQPKVASSWLNERRIAGHRDMLF